MQEKRHVIVSQPAGISIFYLGGKSSFSLGWDEPTKPEKAHVKVAEAPGGKDSLSTHSTEPKQMAHVKVSNPPGGKSSITFG